MTEKNRATETDAITLARIVTTTITRSNGSRQTRAAVELVTPTTITKQEDERQ